MQEAVRVCLTVVATSRALREHCRMVCCGPRYLTTRIVRLCYRGIVDGGPLGSG